MLIHNAKKFLERLISNCKAELAMAIASGNLERAEVLMARIKSYQQMMEEEND